MATEMVKQANFRYKLAFTVALAMVLILFVAMNHAYSSNNSSLKARFIQAANLEFPKMFGPNSQILPLDITLLEENLYSLDQKDPQLVQYTRIKYLNPPSKLPYNFKSPGNHLDSFSSWVAEFFKNKTKGTFIEAGANQGEDGSHTLYLEETLEWTGLLVECNPLVQPQLKTKHRKAWVAEVCLSPKATPGLLNFSYPIKWTYSGTFGKPWGFTGDLSNWTYLEVETIPLYTVLAALGLREVDYFSFDIEGQELEVLRNFPFDRVTFKVLIIEVFFIKEPEIKELNELLKSNGYIFVRKMEIDYIYVHESVKDMIPSKIGMN